MSSQPSLLYAEYITDSAACQPPEGNFRPLPYSVLHRVRPGPAVLWAVLTRFVPKNHAFAQVDRKTLAAILNVSPRTITRWAQNLQDADLLEINRGRSASCPNTYRLFYIHDDDRIRYQKGNSPIAEVPRLDIPERYLTQIGVELGDEQETLGPEAVILWTYLDRQTLQHFTWKAARKALGWTRRNEARARRQLETLGVLQGHQIRRCRQIVHREMAPSVGGDDRSYIPDDVNRDDRTAVKREKPTSSRNHDNSSNPPPEPRGLTIPTAVGSYLEKHPSEKETFFGYLADTAARVSSTTPLNHALQELALYVDSIHLSLTRYFEPILDRHLREHRREIQFYLGAMDPWIADYGEERVEAYREHVRQHPGRLSQDWHTRAAFRRWIRDRGENPEAIRARRREDSERACKEFLASARDTLSMGGGKQ